MNVIATYAGLAAFAWLAVFQAMLAAGLPLGRMAWGGAQRVLPGRLRLASGASALLALVALWAVAQNGGFVATILPGAVLPPLFWGLSVVFGLSLLVNLVAARGLERLHGVPLALLCSGSCLVLALG